MFSHGFLMVRVRRINNGFIGLSGFSGAFKGVHLSPLGFAACQSKKCTDKADGIHLLGRCIACSVGALVSSAPP